MEEQSHRPGARRRRVLAAAGAAALGAAASLIAAPVLAAQRRKRAEPPPRPPETPPYGASPRIEAFAHELSARRGLDPAWVIAALSQARRQPAVERAIMPPPPGTAKNWAAYRDRFVEPRRIGAGLAFWQAHAAVLARAEERWGVPAEIVVGIIGVETFYGRHMGSFRVVDALATLSFDFPTGRRDRSPFFRSELEEFFVLCEREGTDPLQPRGSFAGAMGLPQFMPGSINRYAVDFDGDGHVDLMTSAQDAIGSVAHYLAAFGWERGVPTHFEVAVPVDVTDRAHLLGPDILPSFTPAEFASRGAGLPQAAQAHDGLLALVMLENGDAAPTYVAGTRNFYAITRYNWSSYYALAVITLGQAVRRERGDAAAPATR